jgi:hypothetical protein
VIEEDDVEKAANFIRDNGVEYGKAKAQRLYLDEYRKSKKSELMQKCTGTDKTREAFAYAHPDYISLLEARKLATEEEERLRWMMVAAQAKIEIWRTQQANNRVTDYSHR